MIHFMTLFALMVGGTEVVQPVAGVLAGITTRIDLGLVNLGAFQRRQTNTPQVPPECASDCNPINGMLASGQCTPAQCCLASFETSYFNCLKCVGTSSNVTDYSKPQSIIDLLYDQCASLGLRLPILTFPGQNPNRALSSVVQLPSSQTTISDITSVPAPSVMQTFITALTTTPTLPTPTSPTATASTPNSSPTSSSGIRSMEKSHIDLIAIVMMLGAWFYFASNH